MRIPSPRTFIVVAVIYLAGLFTPGVHLHLLADRQLLLPSPSPLLVPVHPSAKPLPQRLVGPALPRHWGRRSAPTPPVPPRPTPHRIRRAPLQTRVGGSCVVSYYSDTSNQARHRRGPYGTAHRTLPFGTRVQVVWQGRSVVVTVDDRGPFTKDKWGNYNRDYDVNEAAAGVLGMRSAGVINASCRVL